MNRTAVAQLASLDGSGGTIRRQLIWASLFPLAFFGMLAILAMAAALYETTLALVSQRNTAQVQAAADQLAWVITSPGTGLPAALETIRAESDSTELLLVTASGSVISQAGKAVLDDAPLQAELAKFTVQGRPRSLLVTSPISGDQIILSFAPVRGTADGLLMLEPWSLAMTPAYYYQLLLVALLLLGTILSLVMLSASVGRIIRPISELAHTAEQTIPGSVFHPVPERGPVELRSLTASFNQMVIQLAEQQATLRQYAQKALLSQEEERQRLSHELHDGTVQDLVGLAQRLELCQQEMQSDPPRAKQRLAELKQLAQNTLDEVRRLCNALRPSILQDLGLEAALRVLSYDLEEDMPAVQCACRISEASEPRRLQPDIELAIFRVAQEALTNIRKHAGPVTQVCVALDLLGNAVQLEVRDNGRGAGEPDIAALVREGHLGYAGMQERARLFGGKLEVSSPAEGGTIVCMSLPL